jgi:hypothetical protein
MMTTQNEAALNAIHEFLGIAKEKIYPQPDKPNSDWAKLKAAVDGLALLSASAPAAPLFTPEQVATLFVALGNFESSGSKKCAASIRSILEMHRGEK